MTKKTVNTRKPLILFHSYAQGPCPDGFWSSWVARRAYPDADIHPVIYGQEITIDPDEYCQVIIVDFSFPKAKLLEWHNQGIQVVLIDHHKTALNDLGDLTKSVTADIEVFLDMQESGATLAWKTFFPEESMPAVLEYVRDRDIWTHSLESTHEVYAAMSMLHKSYDMCDFLAEMSQDELLDVLYPLGSAKLKCRQETVAAIAKRVEFLTIAGYEYIPTVYVKPHEVGYISDVCQSLYLRFPEAPFSCCAVETEDEIKYSLRSNKDGNNTDVSAIAKAHGGGGHQNSSGFSTKIESC